MTASGSPDELRDDIRLFPPIRVHGKWVALELQVHGAYVYHCDADGRIDAQGERAYLPSPGQHELTGKAFRRLFDAASELKRKQEEGRA